MKSFFLFLASEREIETLFRCIANVRIVTQLERAILVPRLLFSRPFCVRGRKLLHLRNEVHFQLLHNLFRHIVVLCTLHIHELPGGQQSCAPSNPEPSNTY